MKATLATLLMLLIAAACTQPAVPLGTVVPFASASAAPTATPVPSTLTYTVLGHLDLNSSSIGRFAGHCNGTGGYSDLTGGAPVILRDEHGTIIASTVLRDGQDMVVCRFSFTLLDVPDTAKFYAITVGRRGEISESHDELAADGWEFGLTLGS